MKRISDKRRASREYESQWRADFVQHVGRCEVCGSCPYWQLCCHEICSNAGMRSFVLTNTHCIIVVGKRCHDLIHEENWPEARQLACLYRSRPFDLCLSDFNHWYTGTVTREEVMQWL